MKMRCYSVLTLLAHTRGLMIDMLMEGYTCINVQEQGMAQVGAGDSENTERQMGESLTSQRQTLEREN